MVDKYRRHRLEEVSWREAIAQVLEGLEFLMTEQDQLKGQLDNIETGISGVSAKITDLLNQIAAGNTNPSLQPLIDEAASEASQLQGLAQSQPAPTPSPTQVARPGMTPATATPAPVEELVGDFKGEDITVTPSTGVRTPTTGS